MPCSRETGGSGAGGDGEHNGGGSPAGGRGGRRRRWPWVLGALLVAGHMLLFDRGLGGDGWATFAELSALFAHGNVWLEHNNFGVDNGLIATRGGHLVAQYPPGILALDAGPFLAGRLLDRLLPARVAAAGAELPPVGRVPRGVFLSAAAIVLARNLATLLGLACVAAALLRLGVAPGIAAAAAALTFFGGPLVFYSLVGMTHAPSFALAALLLLLLVEGRESGSAFAAPAGAGLVLGCALLVRYDAVALLPAALWAVPAGGRRRLAFLAAAALPGALVLPWWWRALFGGGSPPPYGGTFRLSWAAPWNVLAAPVHGLFLFHPALLLAATALVCTAAWELRRRRAGWGAFGLTWFLGVAAFHGCWSEWANSGGYGQRFMTDALPACALGFARFLAPPRTWKIVAAGLATVAGYVLFFAAVGGLAAPPAPTQPWPQRLADYAPLLDSGRRGPAALLGALRRASFLARAVWR